MAKKAKSKKGAKRKAPGKSNLTPKLECPIVIDLRTPQGTESSGRLATLAVRFVELFVVWVLSVRKHFAGGGKQGDLPQFDEKHFVDGNKGAQTQKQYDKDVDRYNDGEKMFFAPRYNPVLVDLCHDMNAITLRRGFVSKHPEPPKDWDEKQYGSWYLLDEEGNYTIPSGWFFDEEPPRRCHSRTAEGMINDPAANILTFGNYRYVVGDGTAVRCAAMLVWAFRRGNSETPPNYWAGDSARKRMSIAGNKDIPDVVFRIEDKANNGGGFTVKAHWDDVNEMVFMPGQAMTTGFLFDAKGNRLTAKEIRGLDGDTKGLKFKTVRQVLDSPIVGKAIDKDRLWDEIQTIQGNKGTKKMRERGSRGDPNVKATPRKKSMDNLHTTSRVGPNEATPFGLRAAQFDMVPYTLKGANGEFSMGIVIGDRSNFDYDVGVHEAGAEEAEVEAVENAPAPKKAAKPKKAKAKKAPAPKKAAKPAEAKEAKPADAAPAVEADDAETGSEVKEEVVSAGVDS